jgi:hypothetical protein
MTFSDILSLAANSYPRRAISGSAPHVTGDVSYRTRLGQPYGFIPRRRIEGLAPRGPATRRARGGQWI